MEQPSNQTLADIELLHETGNATADSGHPSEETGASSELSDCYEVLQRQIDRQMCLPFRYREADDTLETLLIAVRRINIRAPSGQVAAVGTDRSALIAASMDQMRLATRLLILDVRIGDPDSARDRRRRSDWYQLISALDTFGLTRRHRPVDYFSAPFVLRHFPVGPAAEAEVKRTSLKAKQLLQHLHVPARVFESCFGISEQIAAPCVTVMLSTDIMDNLPGQEFLNLCSQSRDDLKCLRVIPGESLPAAPVAGVPTDLPLHRYNTERSPRACPLQPGDTISPKMTGAVEGTYKTEVNDEGRVRDEEQRDPLMYPSGTVGLIVTWRDKSGAQKVGALTTGHCCLPKDAKRPYVMVSPSEMIWRQQGIQTVARGTESQRAAMQAQRDQLLKEYACRDFGIVVFAVDNHSHIGPDTQLTQDGHNCTQKAKALLENRHFSDFGIVEFANERRGYNEFKRIAGYQACNVEADDRDMIDQEIKGDTAAYESCKVSYEATKAAMQHMRAVVGAVGEPEKGEKVYFVGGTSGGVEGRVIGTVTTSIIEETHKTRQEDFCIYNKDRPNVWYACGGPNGMAQGGDSGSLVFAVRRPKPPAPQEYQLHGIGIVFRIARGVRNEQFQCDHFTLFQDLGTILETASSYMDTAVELYTGSSDDVA